MLIGGKTMRTPRLVLYVHDRPPTQKEKNGPPVQSIIMLVGFSLCMTHHVRSRRTRTDEFLEDNDTMHK